MRKYLAAALLVAIAPLSPRFAHAEEKTIFEEAFPKADRDAPPRVGQMAIGTGEFLGGTFAGRTAMVRARNSLDRIHERESRLRGEALSLAIDDHPELSSYLYLKQKEELLGAKAARELADASELKKLKELKTLLARDPLAAKAERVLKEELEALASKGPLDAANTPNTQGTEARRFRIVRAAGAFGLVAAYVDGLWRITAALNGRDPGFSPAVTLSRTVIKGALSSGEKAREPAAGSSLSAE